MIASSIRITASRLFSLYSFSISSFWTPTIQNKVQFSLFKRFTLLRPAFILFLPSLQIEKSGQTYNLDFAPCNGNDRRK